MLASYNMLHACSAITGSYTAPVASMMLPLLLLMLLLAFAAASCCCFVLLAATTAIMYITITVWLQESYCSSAILHILT